MSDLCTRYPDEIEETPRLRRRIPNSKFIITPEEREQYSLAKVEMRAIKAAVEKCQGNLSRAATLLGINRRTLQRKFPPEIR